MTTNNINQLIKTTIESGRLYPRPQEKCDICDEKIILCWSNKISPYWRHYKMSNTNNNHKPNNESLNHKLAKNILIEQFSQQKRIIFNHHCDGTTINIPDDAKIFKPEVRFEDCIFDIGCFNDKDELIFGIEIWYTHKTGNIYNRNKIKWVEVKANDVLNCFDNNNLAQVVNLSDYSTQMCCSRPLNLCTNLELAEKLNYLFNYTKTKECDSRQIFHVINYRLDYGIYYLKWKWNFTGDYKNHQGTKKIWDEFLKRKKCMYCSKKWDTQIYKPYCKECFDNIQNKKLKVNINEEINFTKEEREELKNSLLWLQNFKNKWKSTDLCEICKNNFNPKDIKLLKYRALNCHDKKVLQHTKIDKIKKRICAICFDNECIKRNIKINFRDKSIISQDNINCNVLENCGSSYKFSEDECDRIKIGKNSGCDYNTYQNAIMTYKFEDSEEDSDGENSEGNRA